MKFVSLLCGSVAVAALTSLSAPPALAQEAGPRPAAQTPAPSNDPKDQAHEVEELVVTGKPRGSVEGEIPPELTLQAEDIQAYGAANIEELIAALAPQLRSGQGRGGGMPVFLVNGLRISGFQELRGIPPEAIQTLQILPEEVALTYGYRPDQRVVNFILKKQFKSLGLEANAGGPTQGGRVTVGTRDEGFKVNDNGRASLDVQYSRATGLLESERSIVRTSAGAPYDLQGNVTGSPIGTPVSPALSARVGSTVYVAGVPTGVTNPTLSDFAATAGKANTDDLTAWRSLLPETETASLRGAITRSFNKTTTATLSGALEDTQSLSYQGLQGFSETLRGGSAYSPFTNDVSVYRYLDPAMALNRNSESLNGTAAVAVNGATKGVRWTFTGNYTHATSSTETARGYDVSAYTAAVAAGTVNPFASINTGLLTRLNPDTADSTSNTGSADLVLIGELFRLPAGAVQSTLHFGADTLDQSSTTVRSGVRTDRDLSRRSEDVQWNGNVPISRNGQGLFTKLGDLSANFNVRYQNVSDFGGLSTVGGGVHWSPVDSINVLASFADEHGAPSASNLNDPTVVTVNVPVFDLVTGQSVLVTTTSGGNPNLKADNRKSTKLGVSYRPKDHQEWNFNANYTRNEIFDAIASFPTVTPALEAAFPTRFTRNAAGTLTAIDTRPVNFDRTDHQELRVGFDFFHQLGPKPPSMFGGGPGGGGRSGGGGRGGGGGGGFRGPPMMVSGPPGGGGGGPMMFGGPPGGPQQGRGVFQLSAYVTWNIKDEIDIRPGLAPIDRLNGGAIGSGGGVSDYEVQLQGGYFKNGLGLRGEANWSSSTFVLGQTSAQNLYFSDLGTVNLTGFIDFSNRPNALKKYPWLKGSRASLSFNNVFDARQDVHDVNGATPTAYQRDYLDPIGRSVRVSFRKMFT